MKPPTGASRAAVDIREFEDLSGATGDQSAKDAAALEELLPEVPGPSLRPYFVILSGLPGTGKSHFSRALGAQIPVVVLETDILRRQLAGRPAHTPAENRRLFAAVHVLTHSLLSRKILTVLDATNLIERNRKTLYRIADEAGVPSQVIRFVATDGVVQSRLERRMEGSGLGDNSDAGLAVYLRMRKRQEPIQREHMVVDTSVDIQPALRQVIAMLGY